MSANPSAEYILRKNLKKIDWYSASERQTRKYQDKFDFHEGSDNPHAINILKENLEDVLVWFKFKSGNISRS